MRQAAVTPLARTSAVAACRQAASTGSVRRVRENTAEPVQNDRRQVRRGQENTEQLRRRPRRTTAHDAPRCSGCCRWEARRAEYRYARRRAQTSAAQPNRRQRQRWRFARLQTTSPPPPEVGRGRNAADRRATPNVPRIRRRHCAVKVAPLSPPLTAENAMRCDMAPPECRRYKGAEESVKRLSQQNRCTLLLPRGTNFSACRPPKNRCPNSSLR